MVIDIKRQFLDFLKNHPQKYKKTFVIESKFGYEKLSPYDILKEIDEETETGLSILNSIDKHQEILNLSYMNMKKE